jgi:flagellar hook-associated protein 3 FlgL
MRIATTTMYESGTSRIADQQAALLKTQQQIATGRRILTPADDPVAAARVLDLAQGQSMNTQFGANRVSAKNSLSQEESVLQSVTALIQDVQTQVVAAGNGAYSDAERRFIATNLRGRLEELTGLANSRDPLGNYIFSGYQANTQPFAPSADGVRYQGDQGQKMLQVGPARRMAAGDPGDSIFENIPGPGSLVTTADAGNIGSAKLSRVTVFDATSLPSIVRTRYEISFEITAAGTTYNVDTDPPTTGAYVSGEPIRFDGMELTVADGPAAPADGDRFTLEAPRNQSIFTTMEDLIGLLETPQSGAAGAANLKHGLAMAGEKLSNALENVLSVRAAVGSRLNELDNLDSLGEDRNIQYEQAISELQGLDQIKAISDLMQQKLTLEAAQQSFLKISGLSLFSLM